MNSNLIKNYVFRFHFQLFLRHSQIEYQSNRRLNQQLFFQINQLISKDNIGKITIYLQLKKINDKNIK
jgi:hypothetical protein